MLAKLRCSKTRHSWEQKVVMDLLHAVTMNAVLAYRVRLRFREANFTTLKSFRNGCSRDQSFADSVRQLCVEIIGAIRRPQLVSPDTPVNRNPRPVCHGPVAKRYRKRFFLSDEGRSIRLGNQAQHTASRLNSRKTCVVCGTQTSHSCSECNSPLCTQIKVGASNCCFGIFHTDETF